MYLLQPRLSKATKDGLLLLLCRAGFPAEPAKRHACHSFIGICIPCYGYKRISHSGQCRTTCPLWNAYNSAQRFGHSPTKSPAGSCPNNNPANRKQSNQPTKPDCVMVHSKFPAGLVTKLILFWFCQLFTIKDWAVKKCVLSKRTMKVCISYSWRCPGTSVPNAADLRVSLFLFSSGSNG